MQEETKVNRPSPVTEWAQICSKSMRDHLAPKGFAEIRAGVYKGKLKSNIEYLSKEMVDASGKIAFGCVNHYKNRLKERLNEQLAKEKEELIHIKKRHVILLDFRGRQKIAIDYARKEAEITMLQDTIFELDKITVQ